MSEPPRCAFTFQMTNLLTSGHALSVAVAHLVSLDDCAWRKVLSAGIVSITTLSAISWLFG